MAVKIRLARHGSKKRPYYRVVVADSRTRRDGRPIEEVGRYNPMTTPKTISLDLEKIADWQSKGAQLTDAVAALVKAANEGEKAAAAPKKSKKQLAKEAEEAARMAISSPLLETSINGRCRGHRGVTVSEELISETMDDESLELDESEELVSDRIADLVEYLVVSIVDDPDGVSLEVIDGASSSTIEVTVAEGDVAKVIGRHGRTIKAIRTLARALAARLDTSVEVEVMG